MLRAEQLALIQEANQQLLAIRQQEMEYYTNAFSSFGTQGSLLAGFTLGALTGLDMRDFDEGVALPFWKYLFHILASVAVGASIHCVLTTTFANIYGPNLALRGPSGSMVRAVKGMIAEKKGIFFSFILCLISFQLITLAATWVTMQTYAAGVATTVLMIGATYWYKYCLRIYNRFKFIEPDIEWRNSAADSEMLPNASFISRDESSNSTRHTFQIDSSMVNKNVMSNQEAQSQRLRAYDKHEHADSEQSNNVEEDCEDVFHAGYLSKMGKPSLLSKGEWSRRYFVLRGSNMFYYKSREDFEKDPSLSIKNRPISISDYSVEKLCEKDKPPFEFLLKVVSDGDDRRTWHFRCDLFDEMTAWIDSFSKAVKL